MAKCKLLMQTGQVQKIIDFFDGYSDDKVSCKYVKKVGIKAEFECETDTIVIIITIVITRPFMVTRSFKNFLNFNSVIFSL